MPIKTYFKRPVDPESVEAVQYDGTNISEIETWMDQKHEEIKPKNFDWDLARSVYLKFSCGSMPITPGDWVVKRDTIDNKSYFTLFRNTIFTSLYTDES